MTGLVANAFLLGLVAGMVPGPILSALFTEVVQSGFYQSLRITVWAILAEALIACVSLFALLSLRLPESIFYGLSFVGAGILLSIAYSLFQMRDFGSQTRIYFSAPKLVSLMLGNGMVWMFWITVCAPQAVVLGQKVAHGEALFIVLMELGVCVSMSALACIFACFRSVVSHPSVAPVVLRFCAFVFAYFACIMIYASVAYFVR